MKPTDVNHLCCIKLAKELAAGEYMVDASGGVWLGKSSDTGCCSGLPVVKFCPFCGAEIVVEGPNENHRGWKWWTQAINGAPNWPAATSEQEGSDA